jgi:dual specificity tyrosine-phosphorylation-regulated kinase 2/3/4
MHSILRQKINNGFDNEAGFYKVVIGDHIAYRYEIMYELDKGAFGQVVKCFDHKEKCEVAVKITRNTPSDHSNSRSEISRLKSLAKSGAEGVVELKDSVFFRNHYVSVIKKLITSNLIVFDFRTTRIEPLFRH